MVATIAVLSAIACNSELIETNQSSNVASFTATLDGADAESKAVLGTSSNNKPQSMWESGDKITIHTGERGFVFTTTESGKSSAMFSCDEDDFTPVKEVVGIYPSGEYSVDMETKTLVATIPTNQAARIGSYSKNAALAVAYTNSNALHFKNACALLKVTINDPGIKNVEFYGNNNEKITGSVSVVLDKENNEVLSITGTDTWVNLYSEESNWCFKSGNTYFAAIAPADFTKGVSMNLILSDDRKVEPYKKTTTKFELKKNTILDLGVVEKKIIYLRPGVWNNDNAWFVAHLYDNYGNASDVVMKDSDGDGILEAAVPFGLNKVIFCRMNPAYNVFDWNNGSIWNQTTELTIPNTSSLCYLVKDWNTYSWDTLVNARKGMLYLKPNSNWNNNSGRCSAYFYKNTSTNVWMSMRDHNSDGIYEVSLPNGYAAGNYVIFCSMNKNTTTNDWTNKWNQTGDLTIPSNGNNLFTLPTSTSHWDGATTTWSKKTF